MSFLVKFILYDYFVHVYLKISGVNLCDLRVVIGRRANLG